MRRTEKEYEEKFFNKRISENNSIWEAKTTLEIKIKNGLNKTAQDREGWGSSHQGIIVLKKPVSYTIQNETYLT